MQCKNVAKKRSNDLIFRPELDLANDNLNIFQKVRKSVGEGKKQIAGDHRR